MNLSPGYPMGSTEVGEQGNRLSGGERQRLTMAQAFKKCADFIIDEATSAVDNKSEHLIPASLGCVKTKSYLFGDCPPFIHHFRCRLHLCVRQGEVVAKGTHEELLASSPIMPSLPRWRLTQAQVTSPAITSCMEVMNTHHFRPSKKDLLTSLQDVFTARLK